MRSLFFILAILVSATLSAQTLEDYLKIALENNPGIRAKETEYKAALQKLPQAKALPDPTVNASYFLRPMMLPMGNQLGSISVMQMFPWFGALDAMEKEAASMAEVKHQGVSVAQNELLFNLKNAWYPLLELEAKIQIQRENLRILETDKELATARFQQGQSPMVDAIRADIMIDEVKTEIALLEQKRKPLEVAFNRLLNREDNTPVKVNVNLPKPEIGQFTRQNGLLNQNPSLALFDQQIQAAVAGQERADYQRKPMIGAGLQYMPLVKRKGVDFDLPPNTGKDMIMPMVSVTIPIWRKKYDAAVEEQRLMQNVYADQKQERYNQLAASYEMTCYELEKAAQLVELLNIQMIKTQQAIDLFLAAYSNAGQDFDEVLRLQQALFSYQMKKITAQTEYQLALVKLDYLTGQ